jgi:hypothetical protein
MCAGNSNWGEIAVQHGWLYGCRLPAEKPTQTLYFADQDWKKPDRARYIASLEKYQPQMATVLDLERENQLDEVMGWAEDAARIVQTVIIIPKVYGIIDHIPDRIGGADVVLGMPAGKHSGQAPPLWEFGRRPVHLLGGSPQKQMMLACYLNVVSADGNMACKMATSRAAFWRKEKGLKGHWVNLREIGRGDEHDAPYAAFDLSMQNIMAAWKERLTGYC